MKNVEQLYKIPVGDWSGDGHSQCEDYYIKANYSASEMRQAYKETCKKIGLQLNHNKDYTEIEDLPRWDNWRYLLTDYENNSICKEAVDILKMHGFEFSNSENLTLDTDGKIVNVSFYPEDVLELFMWFIYYSMPDDFKFTRVTIDAEPIIGYWNDELNHQIGYGTFY